jgi:arginase
MPEALLAAGFAERLRARRAERIESAPYNADRDPLTRIMNPEAIREYSGSLGDAVEAVLDQGEFPVVLGGDCSILLGTMLALKRRGRYGVLYIDGHPDFYQPEANPINGAASASDLAFATGRGPDVVADIEGRGPLVRDDDVAVFAYRNAAAQVRHRSQPLPEEFLAIDREQVRRLGTDVATREAIAHLVREGGPDGFWIHVDADVLDASIMAAVDDPLPDGLSWDDLRTALQLAASSERAVGLELTIYNPEMDADGVSGRGFAAVVADALESAKVSLSTRTRGRGLGVRPR